MKSVHFKATNVDQLKPGSGYRRLCWEIARKDDAPHSWCIARRNQAASWHLTGEHKGARVRVTQDSALLAIDPLAAGLEPGLYKWDVALSSCSTDGGPSGESCATRYPPEGGQTVRIHSLRAVGCKVRGPAEVNSGSRHSKMIALTFDDGPAADTPQFLDKLRHLKIPATFFVIGQQVGAHSSALKRMLREGHEIGNHTWSHADISAGGGAARSQIVDTNHAVERATGFRPCLLRPPGGSTSGALVSLARSEHMTSVLWSVDPGDWRNPGTDSIIQNVRANTHGGSIILEHDGGGPRGQTLAALPKYVKTLKSRGYRFVTVSELLGYETVFELNK